MKPIAQSIPQALYKRIHEVLPIVCVDIVVRDNARGFVLVRRSNKPEKNKWWFPGGRLLKHERLEDAALRKLKEELGVSGKIGKQLGVYEYESREGYFSNTTAHTICIVYEARIADDKGIKLDAQSSTFGRFRRIRKDFDPYIKEFLKKAGFRI